MTESLTNKIANQLEYYANYSHLECDGLSQIFHSMLDDQEIPHTVFAGVVTHTSERTTPTHFWIDLDDGSRIDYRLQRWLGVSPDIPYGVFDPKEFTTVQYKGNIVEMPTLPREVIDQLLQSVPMSPREQVAAQHRERLGPPLLGPQFRQMLGKSLDEARVVAQKYGYRLEALIPETRVNDWGEEERTGWAIIRSSYDPHKLNVGLDESGNVASYDY